MGAQRGERKRSRDLDDAHDQRVRILSLYTHSRYRLVYGDSRNEEPRAHGREHHVAGYDSLVPRALAQLYKPDFPDIKPVQLHSQRPRGRRAYIHVHGRKARRRLCHPRQRKRGERRDSRSQ